MREIIFRGKRIDNDEWVEGSLVVANGRINNGKYYILRNAADFSFGDNGNRIRIGCFVEVDPDTVGQYTGLTDKNGKRIFEGDILRKAYHPEDDFIVEWNDGRFAFRKRKYTKEYGYESLCCVQNTTDFRKVIGNIYDNPELLKGGDEG